MNNQFKELNVETQHKFTRYTRDYPEDKEYDPLSPIHLIKKHDYPLNITDQKILLINLFLLFKKMLE